MLGAHGLLRSPPAELRPGRPVRPLALGSLVILLAGYLLAKVLEKATSAAAPHPPERGARARRRDARRRALGGAVNPARVIANLLFWFVMFAVMLVAANASGFDSLANVFSSSSATSRASSRRS
jgi:hypothetical protein